MKIVVALMIPFLLYSCGGASIDASKFLAERDSILNVNEQQQKETKSKLEKAINTFPITLDNTVCMDIGASTGGFTDCMLQNGAKKVYSVDVGRGQLAWKLRCDERVINMEKTNARNLTPEQIGEEINFISVDVSFISLKIILPVAFNLLSNNGEMVCLIKPQFEAGRENVGKKGVVRERSIHIDVVKMIIDFALSINFNPFV